MILGGLRVERVKKIIESTQDLREQYGSIEKAYSERIERPGLDTFTGTTSTGARIQFYPFAREYLYQIAENVDAIRIIISTLVREMFRPDWEIRSKFKFKCLDCLKEFQAEPVDDESNLPTCDQCGSTRLIRPDPSNRKLLASLTSKNVNSNGQKFKDMLKQVAKDLEIADDGFYLILKVYEFDDSTGNIKSTKIKEMVRVNPIQCRLIQNKVGRLGYTDDNPKPFWICPKNEHRKKGRQQTDHCGICKVQCIIAEVEVNNITGTGSTSYGQMADQQLPDKVLYGTGEVIFGSKYDPSLIGGYSNLYAVWQKIMTLFYMDNFMLTYFDKMRTPRGLFIVPSRNWESTQRAWDKLRELAKSDPHNIHPFIVDVGERGTRQMAQFIDLSKSLEEMQFIAARDEYRRTIGALYGVLPLFSGDLPTGWNNNSMEVTVTNRAVEYGHQVLKERFIDPLVAMLGVTDWELDFKSSEVMDEFRVAQLFGIELTNARQLQDMGFDIEFTHDGKLRYSKTPTFQQLQQKGAGSFGGDKKLYTPSSEPKTDDLTNFHGEPKNQRPSDVGGQGSGSPASGDKTSLSNKSFDEDGVISYITKELESSGDFPEQIVKASVDSMKLEATNTAYEYNFANLTSKESSYVRNVLQLMFTNNMSRAKAIDVLVAIGIDKDQSDVIITTEFNQMRNRAKELAYRSRDPYGEMLYKWDTKDDTHTCQMCKELEYKTRNGVTLDNLKLLISKVARMHKADTGREWILHIRDRCSYVRV